MSRLPFIIVVSLLAVVAAAALFNVFSTTEHTCLECRATLTERRICGVPLSRISRPHPYTTGYLAAHPSHLHSWRWCGTRQSWTLLTHTRACGRRHPIWNLPVEIQADFSRLVSSVESAEPSPNSVAALNLLRLGKMLADEMHDAGYAETRLRIGIPHSQKSIPQTVKKQMLP